LAAGEAEVWAEEGTGNIENCGERKGTSELPLSEAMAHPLHVNSMLHSRIIGSFCFRQKVKPKMSPLRKALFEAAEKSAVPTEEFRILDRLPDLLSQPMELSISLLPICPRKAGDGLDNKSPAGSKMAPNVMQKLSGEPSWTTCM